MTLPTSIVARTAHKVLRFASVEAALEFSKGDDPYKRAAWGRGLATKASHACLAIAFGSLGLESGVARADSANAASIRVMQKVGMRHEGAGAPK